MISSSTSVYGTWSAADPVLSRFLLWFTRRQIIRSQLRHVRSTGAVRAYHERLFVLIYTIDKPLRLAVNSHCCLASRQQDSTRRQIQNLIALKIRLGDLALDRRL